MKLETLALSVPSMPILALEFRVWGLEVAGRRMVPIGLGFSR